jgi:hypothetical protein
MTNTFLLLELSSCYLPGNTFDELNHSLDFLADNHFSIFLARRETKRRWCVYPTHYYPSSFWNFLVTIFSQQKMEETCQQTSSPRPITSSSSRPSSSSVRPSSAAGPSENLIKLFQETQFDDGLGSLESYQFLSTQLLPQDRKLIYSQAGCFELSDVIYSVKYQKSDGVTILEHLLLVTEEGKKVTPIYCECGISYEPLSPSGQPPSHFTWCVCLFDEL